MKSRMLAYAFGAGFAIACIVAGAADKTPRTFPLGALGTLTLPVDSKWRDIPPPPNSAPTLTFESAVPNRFQLLLTPVPVAGGRKQSDSDVRALVEKSAKEAAPQSVEKNLPVTGIAGDEAKGYVFHATDPAPAPGEFRRMYQGAVAVGSILATFTVLYNDGAEDDAKSALSSIQAMRYMPAK
jgi:hypothetical protein